MTLQKPVCANTNDENNFNDPLHTTSGWVKPILEEFWTGQTKYSVLLNPSAERTEGSTVAAAGAGGTTSR
jgi:hypothetical protein